MAGGGRQFVLNLLACLDHGGHHRGAVVAVDGLVRPVLCGGGRVLNINNNLSPLLLLLTRQHSPGRELPATSVREPRTRLDETGGSWH